MIPLKLEGLHRVPISTTPQIRSRDCTAIYTRLLILGTVVFWVGTLTGAPRILPWGLHLPPVAIGSLRTSAAVADLSAVAPFIFDSVQGLLKQWPNSYAPNGHSIVAGMVPAHMVLYHASARPGPFSKPTFFAFDA